MDYGKLMKQLTTEMKKSVQYANIPKPYKLFAILAMIPLIVSFVLGKVGYQISIFFYKMVSAPAEHLHQWLRKQKDEVQHATQAVMYFICLPVIFSLQVTLSFCAISFFFQWFFLMLQGYLLTLGGIHWQPYINEATFEPDETEYEHKPEALAASIFACFTFGSLALTILFGFVGILANGTFAAVMSGMGTFFMILYLVAIFIVNPCMFKRIPKK